MRPLTPELFRTAKLELARPVIRPVWEILCLATRSRTPARSDSPLAVVVHSFDGYKRFWAAARHFTERAIPAPFPIFYMSERVAMHPDPARCIFTGEGGFSTRLARGLDIVSRSHKYVFYLQEDIWIDEPIPAAALSGFVQRMENDRLDCLKLGWASFWPQDHKTIVGGTDRLPGSSDLRWFGPHRYSMSHHCSIFRSTYFWRTALLARLFGREHPLKSERFISEALKRQVKARNADRKRIRVAVWDRAPLVSYTHACFRGRLTPDGRDLLEKHGLLHLYDESLPGEVLPETASETSQIPR